MPAQAPAAPLPLWLRALRVLGVVAAWVWTLVGGVGGLLLLLFLGPWPLTNGWFAMFSGLAACPLLPQLLRKTLGVDVRWRSLLGAAGLIMVAGRIAVAVEGPLPPDPTPTGIWKILD
jgi:hypothetical protein